MSRAAAHTPRKRFGQNFLTDPGVIARILAPQARFLPYALVEVEDGQVGSRLYGIGALHRGGLDLRLEYSSDEQLQYPDEALVLAVAALSF